MFGEECAYRLWQEEASLEEVEEEVEVGAALSKLGKTSLSSSFQSRRPILS